jgi:hypothetical protein
LGRQGGAHVREVEGRKKREAGDMEEEERGG